MQGQVFKATLSSVVLSTAAGGTDLFDLATGATSRIAICGFELGLSSTADFADAAAEGVALQLIRGSTAPGTGGAAITPVNAKGHAGRAASSVTATGNNATTIASSANTEVLLASAWNIQQPYRYNPRVDFGGEQIDERDYVTESSRVVLRLPVPPADPLTVNATIWWQELGKFSG